MSLCPKAVCLKCGERHSGWSLAEKTTCECGGKLLIDPNYDVVIGFVRSKEGSGDGGAGRGSITRGHTE